MRWIREHKGLTAFLSTFLAICIILSVSYLSAGSNSAVGNLIQRGTAIVAKPLASAKNGVTDSARGIFRFKSVIDENETLREENDRLQQELIQSVLQQRELQELRELSNVLNHDSVLGIKNVMAANIIELDGSNWFNIFTIDKGAESGIEKGDIVVDGTALIGRIIEVDTGSSKVTAIIDESSKVSFEVLRDLSIMGIVQGDGTGNLSGFTFNGDAGVVEGDELLTSGIGIYEAGIIIGTVTAVSYNDDTQLKTIVVEPSVKFNSLKKVAVIL